MQLILDPDLCDATEVADPGARRRVLGAKRKLRIVFQPGVVVAASLRGCNANILVGDELVDVEVAVGALEQLQRLDRGCDRLAIFGLPGDIAGLKTERTVKEVVDLGLDAGDLCNQLAVFLRLLRDQAIRLDRRAGCLDSNHRAELVDFSADQLAFLPGTGRVMSGLAAGTFFGLRWRGRRPRRPQSHFRRHSKRILADGALPRRDELSRHHPGLASVAGFLTDRFPGLLRATRATIDPAPSRASSRSTQCRDSLPDGLQRFDAVRPFDRRHADSMDRYARLFLRRHRRQSCRAGDDFHDPYPKSAARCGKKKPDARHARRIVACLEHANLSLAFCDSRHRHVLHQALHAIHAGICSRYSPRRRAGVGFTANGSRCWRHLGWAHPGVRAPFSKTRSFAVRPRRPALAPRSASLPRLAISPPRWFSCSSPARFKQLSCPSPQPCCNCIPTKPTADGSCRCSV